MAEAGLRLPPEMVAADTQLHALVAAAIVADKTGALGAQRHALVGGVIARD
jgi:hypothetical protein